MHLIHLEFYAHTLGGAVPVNVLLPAPTPEELAAQGAGRVYAARCGRRWPALLLLHGMQGNEGSWLRSSLAELYAAKYQTAVVMPALLNSYGLDLGFDLSFQQYLSEELPAFLSSVLPIDCSAACYSVAGLSMGGFAALHLALHYPARYAAAGSFSGAVDPQEIVRRKGAKAAGAVLAGTRSLVPGDGVRLPPIYLACGAQDPLVLEMNRSFHAYLGRTGVSHTYEEWDGGHDWTFWDTALNRFFAWRAGVLSGAPAGKELTGCE